MKTIRLVVELTNVPDECTAEKFRTIQEEGELPSCIADTDAITISTVLNFGAADQNIALTIRKIVPKIVNNATIFLSYLYHCG